MHASDSIKIKEISISLEQAISYKINVDIYKINCSFANTKLLHAFAASPIKIFVVHNQ